ncbi:DUF6504 family protein [Ornithinimicrobium cavernae]|uniref:DUF6504 family protein n=1 Tax=Ornithinimicrobium cavernae TaxID=2666047 RepID=UPI000D694E11|nr:DUF6504 family protein [Ornithinimicrobium cavernae]
MSRRYSDPVEVRVGEQQTGWQPVLPAGLDAASAPTAFIWRGRLHVVRAVLDHWTQRLPWWRRPGGQEDTELLVSTSELEREVWRVEASAGRLMQTGVYDLTKDDRWRLVRVAD